MDIQVFISMGLLNYLLNSTSLYAMIRSMTVVGAIVIRIVYERIHGIIVGTFVFDVYVCINQQWH